MGFVKDLTGKKFGRLTVISEIAKRSINRAVYWNCVCDCGSKVKTTGNALKSGHTKSCGCLYDPEMNTKHGYNRRGQTKSEYRIWCNMKYRCQVKTYKEFYLYGGRGIKVCKRWLSFENFISDMGDRPSDKYSLDRINTNGNYEPENCRWATSSEQNHNRRSNRWIEHNGTKLILADWARKFGTSPSNVLTMMKRKPFNDIVIYYTK